MNDDQNIKWALYTRVSQDREDKQYLGVESQGNDMKNLAKREGLNIVRVLSEEASAYEQGRSEFNDFTSCGFSLMLQIHAEEKHVRIRQMCARAGWDRMSST